MKTASRINTVWMVSREYGNIAGAGGVKDVVQQLAGALAALPEYSVTVVLPLYGFIAPEKFDFTAVADPLAPTIPLEFDVDMNYGLKERRERCRVWQADIENVHVYLIEAERFQEKHSVYTYTELDVRGEEWKKSGAGHYDYFAMNVLLQKSSLELMVLLDQRPDVIHCHDGHTALIPALIHECQGWRGFFRNSGCLVTVHNAGIGYHQEVADLPFAQGVTGLPWGCIGDNRLAGKFDPFLAAGQYAVLNTVSENYARELQATDEDRRTDWLGHTLLERGVTLEGVTNGIMPEHFDPTKPEQSGIPAAFNPASRARSLPGKNQCKSYLLRQLADRELVAGVEQCGYLRPAEAEPLYTFIGRLNEQKGIGQYLEAIEQLFMRHDGQAVILGSGSEFQEREIKSILDKPALEGRVCFLRGYSPELANLVYAAGDFFVIPSQYEPCGLTDYIAQLFANIPVVHAVGGLVKVVDGVTGVTYNEKQGKSLQLALERSVKIFSEPALMRKMQRKAIKVIRESYTWDVVVERYIELYIKAKKQRAEAHG